MTTVTGSGSGANSGVQQAFAGGTVFISTFTDTTIVANGITFTGTGFTYTSSVQNGQTIYQPTGGTITGVSSGSQSWSGFSVSLVTAFQNILNASAFNNLFFGGDDTFTWTGSGSSLSGYGGNDTFNLSNVGSSFGVDGGSGTDTVNLSGGLTGTINPTQYENNANFSGGNVETINLAGGSNYTFIASDTVVSSGNTLTINGSALGAANSFKFDTNQTGGLTFSGNIVLIGGAGDDFFQGGSGQNIYNGGAGTDTVSFWTGRSFTGVTADLSNPNAQSIGGGRGGTATFSSIENLIGTRGNDTLTGDSGNNVLDGQGGADILNGGGGDDTLIGEGATIDGGTGNDTAVYSLAKSYYTIGGSGSSITIAGPNGTSTLTNVEYAQFADQTVFLLAPIVATANTTASRNVTMPLSNLFTVTNVNGSITQYQIYDNTTDPLSGHFEINGVAQAAGTVINVTPAQLSQVTFVTNKVSDTLQIRAFNGSYWSAPDNGAWSPFTITVNNFAPFVSTFNHTVGHYHTYTMADLNVVAGDADGDPILSYQIYDNTSDPNSGHFAVNGQALAARTTITLTPTEYAQLTYVAGSVGDDLQIRAFDGIAWSAADAAPWSPFTVTIPANRAPVVNDGSQRVGAGQSVTLANLANVSDADGDTITEYQLWDDTTDPNSGHFVVNGQVQAAHTVIDLTAAQAAQTAYVAGTVNDDLQIRAYDGYAWSAADTAAWAPITIGPAFNHIPQVSGYTYFFGRNVTVPISAYLGTFDIDSDPITAYQIEDNTTDPNSGYFTLNGVTQTAGTVIDITPAQWNNQLSFVTGNMTDTIQVRAFDGLGWSLWTTSTFNVPNTAPVVMTSNLNTGHNQTLALSSLFSVSDADGDTMTSYQVLDSSTASSSGHFRVNGIDQAAGTPITITASQLAQTSFITGNTGDSLQIRAFDGSAWSAPDAGPWAPFTITVPPNSAPVVTTNNVTKAHFQSYSLASLLTSVSDPDSDPIIRYQLYDNTSDPNSGHFTLNGQALAARTVIDLTAAQAAQVFFFTGSVGDDLQVRVSDGLAWSAADNANWAPFTITVPANSAPVATTHTSRVAAGQTRTLSNLVSVSDADGDTIVRYQIYDNTSDPNSGHFLVNGQAQPARATIDLTAAQAAQTTFLTGTVNDDLQIRVFDGISWSAADTANWAPFTIGPLVNNPPVVTTGNAVAVPGQTIALSSLFSVSDPDGDSMTRYQLYDSSSDPNSGHFMVNGQVQSARTVIDLTAAQAAQTVFVAGRVNDDLQIRAFDGISWSAADSANWAPFTVAVPANSAPVVTTADSRVAAGQTIVLSNLFSVSDADGDTMTRYQLYDGTSDPNSGHFVVNGQVQPARQVIDLTSVQAANTSFVTGTVSDNLQIRVFDGLAWSAADSANWAPFNIGPTVNHAPVATTADTRVAAGQTIALSSLISVSDADGDTMTRYQLYDGTGDPNSGHFTVNGQVQSARTVIDLTAAQAAQTSFVTGTVSDNLQIRVFDGQAWSAADTANWAPFNIGPTVNHAPVVTTADSHAAAGQTIALSSLITVNDADGDTMTRYQLYDGTSDPNSGHFVVNGVAQSARTVIDLTAAQAAQTSFITGTVSDNLQARVFDGQAWSAADTAAWAPFNIGPTVNHAPVVTTGTVNTQAAQTLALSSLFSVSDADGDTMTHYQLWDDTTAPNSGHFVVSGVTQAAHTVIDISAAQLNQTSFVTGSLGDVLQIRTFDGMAWSAPDSAAWAPFQVNVS